MREANQSRECMFNFQHSFAADLMPDSAQRFRVVELYLIAFAPAPLRID
jgi:hypothetical protein